MDFFKTWIHAGTQNEYIAYDVTSISSCSKDIENLEWGYNRNKENLPQVNLAIYYGEKGMLPLYYSIYLGSIPDKTHLSYMLRDNDLIGYKKVKYVMDRVFFSKDNLKHLVESGCRFIMSMPNSLKVTKSLIDCYREEVVSKAECWLGKDLPYAKEVIIEEFDIRFKAHIYYSVEKLATEQALLLERIEEYEKNTFYNDRDT